MGPDLISSRPNPAAAWNLGWCMTTWWFNWNEQAELRSKRKAHPSAIHRSARALNRKANEQPVDLPVAINRLLGRATASPPPCDLRACVRCVPVWGALGFSVRCVLCVLCMRPSLTHECKHLLSPPCVDFFLKFLKNLWIIGHIFLRCLGSIEIFCKSFWKIWHIFMLFSDYITLSNKLYWRNHCKYSNKTV